LARRVYLIVFIFLALAWTIPRIRSMLIARQIHAVLAGMQKIRLDQTTERELLNTVPHLVRSPDNRQDGQSLESFYSIEITNEREWERLLFGFSAPIREKLAKVLDWFGYRYIRLAARIVVLDGKVSSISYGISPQLAFPRAASEIVSARSLHGFWAPYRHPIEVDSLVDQNLQFQIDEWSGQEGVGFPSLHVTYATDAPAELVAQAFDVNLSCFWSFSGCNSPREMVPEISHQREITAAQALSRLQSGDPCPARVLEQRVRYLLDLDVILLEAVNIKRSEVNEEGERYEEFVTDYRVKETIRGGAGRYSWKGIRRSRLIPRPLAPLERILNPVPPPQKVGDQVLFFGGDIFYSCRFVPATAATVEAVRRAISAPKRREDEVVMGLQ
jgi:hypothetical protein